MRRTILIAVCLNLLVLCSVGIKISQDVQEDILVSDVSIVDGEKYRKVFEPITEGVYSVTLEYQATDNYKVGCGGTGNQYPGIYGEEHWLKAAETIKEFRFWANGKIDSPYIYIIHDDTNGRTKGFSLNIKYIQITRRHWASILYGLCKAIMALGVIDVLAFLICKRNALRKQVYVILGLIFIFFAASSEVFVPTQVLGHDLYFHLARIRGIAMAIMSGEFPVKMQPEWFNGYGYPVSVFYGDILLYFPAVLYILNIPLVFCYKGYVLLINLGTTLISYFCFKKISKDKYISVAGTAVYMLSVPRIINIYLRAAVGEYSAAMFLPLVALAMWEVLTTDVKDKKYCRKWIFLCLGMTGIIQTHIISLEITGILLIIVCLINIKKILQKETFQILFKSVAITLAINAGFFIPFLDYSREKLRIFSEKDFYGIQAYGLSLYELFSINTSGVGQALAASVGLNGRIPVSLGCAVALALVLSGFVIAGRNIGDRKREKVLLQLLGLAAIAAYCSSCYFPWNQLASIKIFQNVVASIQFPWRFTTVCVLFVIMAMILTLSDLKNSLGKKYVYVLSAGFCIVSAYQGLLVMDMIERNMENTAIYDGREVMDAGAALEYVYVETDGEALMGDNRVHGENADITEFSRSGNKVNISYKSGERAFLEFPVFAYPYYQCRDNETGEKFAIMKGIINNRIRVQVPDNYEGSLQVSFSQPWYWRAAEIVSIISFLAMAAYIFRKREDIFGFRGMR